MAIQKTNDLKKFITKKFGTHRNCAERLGVTAMTVYQWHSSNPRAMLKHAPEIVNLCDTTWTQLAGEVLLREEELNRGIRNRTIVS
jgi:hypothetical protein|tara:strand:+ start:932 stop:1189 length:258 start_codon:yes stop_codon:yes gene_type:complete